MPICKLLPAFRPRNTIRKSFALKHETRSVLLPFGIGNAGKANMNSAAANDSEKSVDKLAKREKAIKLRSGADTQRYFLNDDL